MNHLMLNAQLPTVEAGDGAAKERVNTLRKMLVMEVLPPAQVVAPARCY